MDVVLPDDIWSLIFRRLPLNEQIKLLRVNQHFEDIIINDVWRRTFKHLYVTKYIPSSVTARIRFVNEDVWRLSRDEYMEFFRRNVYNLETLHLTNLRRQTFSKYLGHHLERPNLEFYLSFQYLELIDLNLYNAAINIHDGIIKLLTEKCPNLNSLNVSNRSITGRYLADFRYLSTLAVQSCNITIDNLDDLLSRNEHLTSLDISDNPILRTEIVRSFYRNLRFLKLDELAFLKQFCWIHEYPRRFRRIRVMRITLNLRNLPEDYDDEEPLRPEWQTFFQYLGDDIQLFRLCTQHEGIRDAVERVYNITRQPTFRQLKYLFLWIGNRQYLGVSKFQPFFESTNLEVVHLYGGDNSLAEIEQLIYNNRNLTHLRIISQMKKINKMFYRKFIDKIISQRRECLDRPLLTLELHQIRKTEKRLSIQSFLKTYWDNNELERYDCEIENTEEMKLVRSSIPRHTEGATIDFQFPLQLIIARAKDEPDTNYGCLDFDFFDCRLTKRRGDKHVNEPRNSIYYEPVIAGEAEDNNPENYEEELMRQMAAFAAEEEGEEEEEEGNNV